MILLILSSLLIAAKCGIKSKPQTDFYKALDPKLDFYSETGYVSIGAETNELFYHLFLRQDAKSLQDVKPTDFFILWLNGGPGCASLMHMFQNVGPLKLIKKAKDDYTVTLSDSAWSQVAHTIFVDQPFNVGLSYGEQVINTQQSAENLIKFLEQFFAAHPTLAKTRFYIFGVSYGGHYVPGLGAALLGSELLKNINFEGIGVGNGWTDPVSQYGSFQPLFNALGVMSESRQQETAKNMTMAIDLVGQGNYAQASLQGFYDIFFIIDQFTGKLSPYSYQEYELDPNAEDPYAGFINQYKGQFDVPAKITYQACNGQVSSVFTVDISTSQKASIEALLAAKKRVLVYNGSFDVICNTPSVNTYLTTLRWDGIYAWKASPKKTWTARNKQTMAVETAGTIKKSGGLYYATVYRAGHMAPNDQDVASLKMLRHFLNDEEWD